MGISSFGFNMLRAWKLSLLPLQQEKLDKLRNQLVCCIHLKTKVSGTTATLITWKDRQIQRDIVKEISNLALMEQKPLVGTQILISGNAGSYV